MHINNIYQSLEIDGSYFLMTADTLFLTVLLETLNLLTVLRGKLKEKTTSSVYLWHNSGNTLAENLSLNHKNTNILKIKFYLVHRTQRSLKKLSYKCLHQFDFLGLGASYLSLELYHKRNGIPREGRVMMANTSQSTWNTWHFT